MLLCFNPAYLIAAGAEQAKIDGFLFDAGQPFSHFHVLSEHGIDSRRILVDDAAPLFYIDRDFLKKFQPKLLLIAADHDMPGRLEQNAVLRMALLHFQYPAENIIFHIMRGRGHCDYLLSKQYQELLLAFIQ